MSRPSAGASSAKGRATPQGPSSPQRLPSPPLPSAAQALSAAIAEARSLIDAHGGALRAPPPTTAPLPSLLDRARALVAEAEVASSEPVRTLHHFACTGGSLFSKLLAALPNSRLLTEIDPLSRFRIDPLNPKFVPTDLIQLLHYTLRGIDDARIEEVFLGALAVLRRQCRQEGERLILRDHTHSHFCTGPEIRPRATLRELVARGGPVRSAVTVRDPLESWLSLLDRRWVHFEPGTAEEYARRYLVFLDAYVDVPFFRYEDLVAEPERTLEALAAALALPFDALALEVLEVVHVTGDSGRTGTRISPRPRRVIPDEVAAEVAESESFRRLRARLGYVC